MSRTLHTAETIRHIINKLHCNNCFKWCSIINDEKTCTLMKQYTISLTNCLIVLNGVLNTTMDRTQ